MKGKIGIGVISVNRPDFFEECISSLPESDVVIEVINGENNYSKNIDKVFYQKEKQNVAKNKNIALKFLKEDAECEHIFLCEDDIRFEDKGLCKKYIETAEETGIKHFNYGGHGFYNRNPDTQEILVKQVIEYKQKSIDLYHNILGAWSYYHADCIDAVGYMNENFNNAMEHVEHTYRIHKDANLHPPFWWFADIHCSYDYIKDIKSNFEGSEIRKGEDWQQNLLDACRLFKQEHGYTPMDLPDVGLPNTRLNLLEIYKCKK